MERKSKRFRSSLQLLTRIPVRVATTPDYSRIGRDLPLVGSLVGLFTLLVGGILVFLLRDAVVVALLLMGISYLAFNLFHFDGLVDCADAFLGPGDAERTVRILKDSRTGVYGLFAGVAYLVLKSALLVLLLSSFTAQMPSLTNSLRIPLSLVASHGIPVAAALLSFPVAGRLAASLLGATLSPVEGDGLRSMVGRFRLRHTAVGTVLSVCAPAAIALAVDHRLWDGALLSRSVLHSIVAIAIGAAIGWIVSWVPFSRRLKGFTGDGMGLAIEVGEIASLFAAWTIGTVSGWVM